MTAPALHPDAIAPARAAYVSAVKAGGGPSAVVAAVLSAYLAAANDRPIPPAAIRRTASLSPTTRAIASLGVGEETVLFGADASNLTQYFGSVRRCIGVADAKWTASTQPDGSVRVLRNPNGFGGKDPRRNKNAVAIASMVLGESRLFPNVPGLQAGGTWNNVKRQARRILDDPEARWTRVETAIGLRITRALPLGKGAHHTDPDGLPPEVLRILRVVAHRHHLRVADLRGPSRTRNMTRPRWEAMALLHALRRDHDRRRYSLMQVGAFLNRDHTSVLHALRKLASDAA